MRCDQCQFVAFDCHELNSYEPEFKCHRRPPTQTPSSGPFWPTVHALDWCGDFRADQLLVDYAGLGLSAEDRAARRKQMQPFYDKRVAQ